MRLVVSPQVSGLLAVIPQQGTAMSLSSALIFLNYLELIFDSEGHTQRACGAVVQREAWIPSAPA